MKFLIDTNVLIYYLEGQDAAVNDLSIMTRNIKDFKSIAGLGILDPFK